MSKHQPSGIVMTTEDVLFWAFRYALGRATYSVKDVADAIKQNMSNLTEHTRRQMLKEIIEAGTHNGLGGAPDIEEWEDVRRRLVNSLPGDRP